MNCSQLTKILPTFWQLTVYEVHNSSPLELIRSPSSSKSSTLRVSCQFRPHPSHWRSGVKKNSTCPLCGPIWGRDITQGVSQRLLTRHSMGDYCWIKWKFEQILSQYFWFLLSVSFHERFLLNCHLVITSAPSGGRRFTEPQTVHHKNKSWAPFWCNIRHDVFQHHAA